MSNTPASNNLTNTAPRITKWVVLSALLLSLLHLVICIAFARIQPDLNHDGFTYKNALDVSAGAVPFRDSFSLYGVLFPTVQSWALKLFGPYVLVLRLQTALAYAGVTFVLFLIWARVLPLGLAVVSCVFWIFVSPHFAAEFRPWPTVYALLFVLLSTLALMRFIDTSKRTFLFLAGLGGGLAWGFKQSMGGFQMGGLVLFWLIALIDRAVRTRREDGERVVWQARGHDVVYLCAGCLVIVGSVLLWLLWNGAMGDWYRQSIVFPLKGYIVFVCQKSVLWAWYDNGVQLALADLRTKWFWPMWGIAIILCGIRAIADRNLLLVCLAAVSLASWFNVLPVPCDGHQWWAFTPGFCFLPLLIWDFLKLERAVYRLLATTAVLLFVLGGPIYKGCVIGWERLSTCTVPISPVPAGPNYPPALTGMLDNEQRAKAYVELIQSIGDYLDRHPGKQLAILGETGAVFLPPDRNYHPLFVEWIYITTNIYANYHSMKRAWLQQNRPLLFTTSLQLEIHKQRYNCDLKELEHYAAVKVLPIPCIAERWDYVLLAPVEEK